MARTSQEHHDMVEIEKKVAKSQGIKHSLAEAEAEHSSDDEDAKQGKKQKATNNQKSPYNQKSPKPLDTSKDLPTVEFKNHFDHEGHQIFGLDEDVRSVKVTPVKAGKGNWAKLDDWTIVHWKTWHDGQQVEDSRTSGDKKPKTFRLGNYEVPKCWDIAI